MEILFFGEFCIPPQVLRIGMVGYRIEKKDDSMLLSGDGWAGEVSSPFILFT